MFVIIPNELSDAIYAALDAAAERAAIPADEWVIQRPLLHSEMVAFVDDNGYIPTFELTKRDAEQAATPMTAKE